jgi:catechol 2,3-dioxygenase-like lactoylglutathione lyase family enzyme
MSGFHHISIIVSDLDRNLKLFRDILGFDLSWRLPQLKGKKISQLLGIPGMEAEVAYLTGPSKGVDIELARLQHPEMGGEGARFGEAGTVCLSLTVEGLEALHRRLTTEGWAPLSPCTDLRSPEGVPYRMFCFRTDEGLLVELMERQK